LIVLLLLLLILPLHLLLMKIMIERMRLMISFIDIILDTMAIIMVIMVIAITIARRMIIPLAPTLFGMWVPPQHLRGDRFRELMYRGISTAPLTRDRGQPVP
jgi:hypothetical protein